MRAVAILPSAKPDGQDKTAAALWAAIEPEFLRLLGWDEELRVLFPPANHPTLGWVRCQVSGCTKARRRSKTEPFLCGACAVRWEKTASQLTAEEFIALPKPTARSIGVIQCRVPECQRPAKTAIGQLCSSHEFGRIKRGLSVEEYLGRPGLAGLAAFGPCAALACTRDRVGHGPYCHAHAQRWRLDRKRSDIDEELWRRIVPAVAQDQEISLRGLPPRVVAELIYGLQQRTKDGIHCRATELRTFADLARSLQVSSVQEIPVEMLSKHQRGLRRSIVTACRRLRTSPELERRKDVWDAAVFGHTGTLRFTEISQPWLRQAAQDWCFDDLPRRRGKGVRSTIQAMINALGRLSESMRLQREDGGELVTALSRADITAYLNRVVYLQHEGTITASKRFEDCRAVRLVLRRMRSIGLTRTGAVLHGLPEDFALSEHDLPDLPEDSEVGRDLPAEVIRHLCQHLHRLEESSPLARVAVELLIDTGRRPDEISSLGASCLERDGDGKPVLIYDNRKALRKARRLPISEATAKLIVAQQERAQASFPGTPMAELKLLPTKMKNPHGDKALTSSWVSTAHRNWVHILPDVLVPVTVTEDGQQVTRAMPFDRSKIFLYAYRHSYAQRHADAGVPVDVLRDLLDHRQLQTTQCYYRKPRVLHQPGEKPQVARSARDESRRQLLVVAAS